MKITKIIFTISYIISGTLIFLMRTIRPFLGTTGCRFFITCTHYAADKLKTESLPRALAHITLRLICCSPFYWFIPIRIRTMVAC